MSRTTCSVNQNKSPRRYLPLPKAIALAATLAVVFWSFQANAYPLHNGEYLFWSAMPAATQVLSDTKGTSDVDTAARQHAALLLLINLVNMDADGKGQTPWPARESELKNAYSGALPDGDGHRDAMLAESKRLRADPTFVQPLLKRYFSADAVREINMVETGAKAASAQKNAPPADTQKQFDISIRKPPGATEKAENAVITIISYIIVFVLFAVCATYIVMWPVRILRVLFGPFKTTSDNPPRFTGGPWKSLKIRTFTGFVHGSATRSDTSVSGSVRTVAGNPAMGIGTRVEGGISSKTTVTDSFRLVNPKTQEEQNFALVNYHLQIWDDQKVSVAEASRAHGNWNVVIVVVNHTTGQVFFRDNDVWELAKRGSRFWRVGFYVCMVIPPIWLLGIVWGIIIQTKSSGFKGSGVQPLVKFLDQKAAELS